VLPPVIHQSGIVTGQNTNLTARAGGGPVSAGAPYLVGELGPELFVPRASGSIVPNGAIAGGGAPQVIQLVVDGRVLASLVNDHTTREMRQSRQFPAA
jgi:phage-related minor tail protein